MAHMLSLPFECLGLWNCAEDLDQAFRNQPVFAVFELPDSKAEAVRIAGMATVITVIITGMIITGMIVAGRSIRIAAAHAASTRTHAPDTDGPSVSQLLHDFLPGDLQLRGINLPAVTRGHVAESLRVELPRQRGDTELLHRVCDHLRSLVI